MRNHDRRQVDDPRQFDLLYMYCNGIEMASCTTMEITQVAETGLVRLVAATSQTNGPVDEASAR